MTDALQPGECSECNGPCEGHPCCPHAPDSNQCEHCTPYIVPVSSDEKVEETKAP